MATLSLVYLGTDVVLGHVYLPYVNKLGPAVLVASCALAAFYFVRKDALTIWTPMPWFLLAAAVYFGFGPLAYYFASQESVANMDSYYTVDESALLRTNLLNSLGMGLVCVSAAIGMMVLPVRRLAQVVFNDREVRCVVLLFLAIGGTVKYVFALPYSLGLIPWILPGSVQHLSSLLTVTIILLFVLVHHGDKKFRWLLYPLIASELLSSAMTFSKLEVIMTMLAILLGRYLCRPNPKMLIGSLAVLVVIYALVLSPFFAFARIAVNVKGVEDPWMLVTAAVEYRSASIDSTSWQMPGVQGWWTRLAYANAQTFAMDAYDTGARGDTFTLIPYSLIPRWLYPEKPIMTTGAEFNMLVTGSDQTMSAPGFFGEAYWNGGWMLVVAACISVGIAFTAFSRFSMRQMERQHYIYLPVVLIGMTMGLRPDDWFVPTVFGASVEAIGLYLVLRYLIIPGLRFMLRVFVSERKSSSPLLA
jgi:hypothetical protein